MALVTLASGYSSLQAWAGNLLDAAAGVAILQHASTAFAYTYNAGTTFAGYTVTETGTGFAYAGTTPISGTMSGLSITDASGHLVLSVTGIAPGTIASDLALFASFQFGWTTGDGAVVGPQTGNAWSELLSGNDMIQGDAFSPSPALPGLNSGNDVFNMGSGNDYIYGGAGNDTINGGAGFDVLAYEETHLNQGLPMIQGITVNVDAGTVVDPFGTTDHFTGIEEIKGSAAADLFIGGSVGMDFEGLRGADTIQAGTSANDWALYQDDQAFGGKAGIVASLGVLGMDGHYSGTIRDGFGTTDTVIDLHSVAGTRYNDSFVGNALANDFAGGEGKDHYNGGPGEDAIDFGWHFTNAVQSGISVNLTLTSGQILNDGFGNDETAYSIEDIIGSAQGDLIKGSTGANVLTGGLGGDTMTGGGGTDTFVWNSATAFGQGDVITDFHAGTGTNMDVLRFDAVNLGVSTTLHLVNGTVSLGAYDTFLFNPANHVLSWDTDGSGPIAPIAIATLEGVAALTVANFDLE